MERLAGESLLRLEQLGELCTQQCLGVSAIARAPEADLNDALAGIAPALNIRAPTGLPGEQFSPRMLSGNAVLPEGVEDKKRAAILHGLVTAERKGDPLRRDGSDLINAAEVSAGSGQTNLGGVVTRKLDRGTPGLPTQVNHLPKRAIF